MDDLASIDKDSAFAAVGPFACFHVKMSAGMILYVPAGYITIVRTINGSRPEGIRTTVFCRHGLTHLRQLHKLLVSVKSPSAGIVKYYLKIVTALSPEKDQADKHEEAEKDEEAEKNEEAQNHEE